jgi:hypothetical protein
VNSLKEEFVEEFKKIRGEQNKRVTLDNVEHL